MSLALQSVTPITVHDPKVVQQDRIYPVLKGGQEVLYKQFVSTNVASTSVGFHCPPPSSHVYVDRCVHLRMPCRLKITANTLTGQNLQNVVMLQPGCFSLRSFPIQRAMETVLMTINTQSMSVNIGDVISAFEHFNISSKAKAIDKSKCATYPCGMSQNFKDLVPGAVSTAAATGAVQSGVRSPLSQNDSAPSQGISKGAPFCIVLNPANSNNLIDAGGVIIDFVSTEALWLSPLYFGDACENDAAFFGVTGMDFTFNFVGNAANRMIAIDGVSNGAWIVNGGATPEQNARSSTMTIQWAFNSSGWNGLSTLAFSYGSTAQPTLLFQYITPQLVDRGSAMQKVLNYPMYTVVRYPVDQTSVAALGFSTTNGNLTESYTTQLYSSTNVQLNTIPSKLYVFARQQNQGLQLNPYSPDSFMRLHPGTFNIQWGSRAGLLASASIEQLYDISVNAGCTLSFADWAGIGQASSWLGVKLAGTTNGWGQVVINGQYYGTGTVFALDPVDLGLDSVDAPGKLEQITLQINGGYDNVANCSFTPTFYVVAISPGLFTLFNGQASMLIGVLNSNDILNSHKNSESEFHSYKDTKNIYGGNFLTDLKSDLKHLRKKVPQASMSGAGLSGGVQVSRTALKDRLM